MTDERHNRPSCSGLERLTLCEGSWLLEEAVKSDPSYKDDGNEMSQRGDRIHAWLKDNTVALEPEELDIAESIRDIENKTRDLWATPGAAIMTKREERLWLKDGTKQVFSGKFDVCFIEGTRALVLDAKSGFIKAPASAVNHQLAGLAVLVAENPRITEVCVGIVQPFVSHQVELCRYDRKAIDAACEGFLIAIEKAEKPNAPFTTGPHCNYCAASLVCPLRQQELKTIASVMIHEPNLIVTNEELGALLDKCGRVMKLVAEIGAEARRRIESGQKIEGWELVAGKGKRKVTDIVTVGERLAAAGASWKDIAAVSTITITNLKTLARDASKKKGRDLAKFVDSVLDGATSCGDAKPRLCRVGAALEDEEES